MRICIICSGFSSIYGGLEEVIFRLCELWVKNGHEVSIISGHGKRTGPSGVRLIKLPFIPRKYFQKMPFVDKVFFDHELEGFSLLPSALFCLMGAKPDIVLSNQLGETFPALFLRVPTIMISQLPLRMRLDTFEKVDRVIVNDPRSHEQLRAAGIKSELVLNGYTTPIIPNIDSELRTKYSIPIDSVVILTVARLYLVKRIHLLIDAFKLIRQPATLIIVGEGPERPFLEKRAHKGNSKNRIIFLKALPRRELDGLYQLCNVFTLPSKIEGLPLTVIQALSLGKIVVTNPSPEKEFILDKFGVYTDVTDPIEYSESLLRAVSMKIDVSSADYIQHMRKFNWDEIALQYEKIFHEVLRKHRST